MIIFDEDIPKMYEDVVKKGTKVLGKSYNDYGYSEFSERFGVSKVQFGPGLDEEIAAGVDENSEKVSNIPNPNWGPREGLVDRRMEEIFEDTLPLLKNGKRKAPNKQDRKAAEKQARAEVDAERYTTRNRFSTETSFFFRKLDGVVGVKIKRFDWKKLEGRKHKRGGIYDVWVIPGAVEAESSIEMVFPITSVQSLKCDKASNSLTFTAKGFDQGKTVPRVYVQTTLGKRGSTKFEEVKLTDSASSSSSSSDSGDGAETRVGAAGRLLLRRWNLLPAILDTGLPIEDQAQQLLKHISTTTVNDDGTFQVSVAFPGKYKSDPHYEDDGSARCFHEFKEYMDAIQTIQKVHDKQKKEDDKLQKQRDAQAAKLAVAAKKAAAKKTAAVAKAAGKKKGADEKNGSNNANSDNADADAANNTPSFADIPASQAPWLHKAVAEFKLNVFPSETGGPGFLDMSVLDPEWEVYVLQRRKLQEEVENLKVGAIAKMKKLYGWSDQDFEGAIPENDEGEPDKTMSLLHLEAWGDLLEEYESEYNGRYYDGSREEVDNPAMRLRMLRALREEFVNALVTQEDRSVEALLFREKFNLDQARALAEGLFLDKFFLLEEEDAIPRTVDVDIKIFSCVGRPRMIKMEYQHHERMRFSFNECFAHINAYIYEPRANAMAFQLMANEQGTDLAFVLFSMNMHDFTGNVKHKICGPKSIQELAGAVFGATDTSAGGGGKHSSKKSEPVLSNNQAFNVFMRAVGVRTKPCTHKCWHLPYNMDGDDCVDFANKRYPAPKFKPKAASKKAPKAKAKSVPKAKAKSVPKAKSAAALDPDSPAASSSPASLFSPPSGDQGGAIQEEKKEEKKEEKEDDDQAGLGAVQGEKREEKKVDSSTPADPANPKMTISKDTIASNDTAAVTNEPASASDSVSNETVSANAVAGVSKQTVNSSSSSKRSITEEEFTEEEFAKMEAEFVADAEAFARREAQMDEPSDMFEPLCQHELADLLGSPDAKRRKVEEE